MEIQKYRIKDFINNDLKIFSNLDNVRSIPSIIDGFKDSQRKAIYGMLQHGPSQVKISIAGSFAAMATEYAHGESSMCETMVGMAQNFPGSNNVNLLEPIGQFGSILSNQSAAHRYIYTKHSPNLRKFIRREDDIILESRMEEGVKLEPLNYYPVLPLWVLNGSVGIGTGHSVRILPRSVENVSKAVTALINNKKLSQDTIDELMTPHFNGWKGTVIKGESSTQWELIGTFQRINSTKIIIDELPIGYEADKFKSILIDLMDKGFVRDFDNNSSEEGFNFEVTVPREVTRKTDEEILKLFKLKLKVGENVTLWDTEGKLKRYDDVFHALKEFVEFRVGIYGKRKEAQLASMDDDLYFMENKIKFITYWNNDLKDPHKKKKQELSKELVGAGVDEKFIDRLLSMQISSLTMELVDELEKAYQKLLKERQVLEGKTETKLFQEDLKDLYRNDLK